MAWGPRRRSPAAGRSPPPRPSRSPAPEPPSSFRHHLSPADSTTDERLEPPEIIPERLGQRVEPRQGVLRPVEPHSIRPRSIRPRSIDTPSGTFDSFALMVSAGTLNRNPVSRACRSSVTKRARRSSSPRNAPRPRCLLSCCRSFVRGRGPLVADELGPEGLHQHRRPGLRHPEEPLDVAPGEELLVEVLELADGIGDGEQPPGLRGHLRASAPRGRRTVWRRLERVRAGDDTPTATRRRLCIGLDGGAGDGCSGSGGGLRLDAGVRRRNRGDLAGCYASGAARAAEGHGELVDVDRQTSRTRPGPTRPRRVFPGAKNPRARLDTPGGPVSIPF